MAPACVLVWLRHCICGRTQRHAAGQWQTALLLLLLLVCTHQSSEIRRCSACIPAAGWTLHQQHPPRAHHTLPSPGAHTAAAHVRPLPAAWRQWPTLGCAATAPSWLAGRRPAAPPGQPEAGTAPHRAQHCRVALSRGSRPPRHSGRGRALGRGGGRRAARRLQLLGVPAAAQAARREARAACTCRERG